MLGALRRWRHARILAQASPADEYLPAFFRDEPLLASLDSGQRRRLRDLVALFLHDKRFYGAHDLAVTDPMRVLIAAIACRLILDLGYEWYEGWRSIIIYPDAFRVPQQATDEAGVVHHWSEERAGEAWEQGAVILSWQDIIDEQPEDEYSVIIHEFAHKLDMRDGEANGCPPLPPSISARRWRDEFQAAFDQLQPLVDRDLETFLDPYAASGPAEFFAVISERYFKQPDQLAAHYPGLFSLLNGFYHPPRQ